MQRLCGGRGSGLRCFSDDEEDETAELLRELEKIKRERAEQREQEVGYPLEITQNDRSLLTRDHRSVKERR